MKKRRKENLELIEEHIDLAEDLVLEEAKNLKGKDQRPLEKVAFELEKAQANLGELK